MSNLQANDLKSLFPRNRFCNEISAYLGGLDFKVFAYSWRDTMGRW